MAALLDLDLLARVERDLDALLAGDAAALAPVVAGAVAAKIAVVEDDPREADRRRLLNFGHTLGHALEAALGYTGLRHGEAVAHGMRFALRLARRRGLDRDAVVAAGVGARTPGVAAAAAGRAPRRCSKRCGGTRRRARAGWCGCCRARWAAARW